MGTVSSRGPQRVLLEQIAATTGGQAFFPGAAKELDAVYEKVVAQVRAQYTIGYQSANGKADGAWRKVEIRIVRNDAKELRVRARKGYFARFTGK